MIAKLTVLSNITLIVIGVFFPPEYGTDILPRILLMTTVTIISIVLLIVTVAGRKANGIAKTWVSISSILAAFILFRWVLTICSTFSWVELQGMLY